MLQSYIALQCMKWLQSACSACCMLRAALAGMQGLCESSVQAT